MPWSAGATWLWAERRRSPLPEGFRVEWRGDAPLALPTGDRLRFHAGHGSPEGVWIVHARRGGERITLPGRGHSHALKHVLQDLGVPPWLRERLPLLSSAGGELLAAADLVASASFAAWSKARGTRLEWGPATP